MAVALKSSWSFVGRRPIILWTTLAGGASYVAGYWTCSRNKKLADKTTGVQGWQWFTGGLVCGVGVVGAGTLLTRRFLYPSPEAIFYSILPKVRASVEVTKLIGQRLEPGLFRAYSRFGGRWEWVGPPSFIKWNPRGLEVMFQVNGESGSGMVSARVLGHRKVLKYQSLAVDLPTGERVILKGNPENIVFKGYTRLR